MSGRDVRIVADDLTGALDAAAPFASPGAPMRLILGRESGGRAGLAGVTASSESRDLVGPEGDAAVEAAVARVEAAAGPAGPGTLRFAKVDSVLRGRPVAETLLKMRLWGGGTCLFAPAFPDMGRRTRDGRHEVEADGAWGPAEIHDLVQAFRAAGASCALRRPGGWPVPRGVIVGDAARAADLAAHVAALDTEKDVVWAGSRGLAQALAGTARRRPVPRTGAVIVGTTHPATRRQVAVLREKRCPCAIVDPAPVASDAAATRALVREAVGALSLAAGDGLVVVGGDTLAEVLAAAEARHLDCTGEVAPGVPVGRLGGGRFDGAPIVTKSGGFGAPDLLCRLVAGDV